MKRASPVRASVVTLAYLLLEAFIALPLTTSATEVQPGQDVRHGPPTLKAGTSFKYTAYSSDLRRLATFEEVIDNVRSNLITARLFREGVQQQDKYYNADLRPVTAHGEPRTPTRNPSAIRLSFPLYVGKTWSDSYEGTHLKTGTRFKYENNYKIVAYEYITTPAGRFGAYQIRRENRNLTSPAVSYEDYWYSPDIGFEIKRIADWGPAEELLEYKVAPVLPAHATAPDARPIESHKSPRLGAGLGLVYGRLFPSVVRITNTDTDTVGAGIIVGVKGEVLTSWHVVRGQKYGDREPDRAGIVYVETCAYGPRGCLRKEGTLAFLQSADKTERDLALIRVPLAFAENQVAQFGSPEDVSLGTPVIAIGHPGRQEWVPQTGQIVNLRARPKEKSSPNFLQTDMTLQPGNSGGPIATYDGKVVGVVSQGRIPPMRSENYSIAIEQISDFLRLSQPAKAATGIQPLAGRREGPDSTSVCAENTERTRKSFELDFALIRKALGHLSLTIREDSVRKLDEAETLLKNRLSALCEKALRGEISVDEFARRRAKLLGAVRELLRKEEAGELSVQIGDRELISRLDQFQRDVRSD